jgi:SAM-dependent methyltransferase
MNVITHSVDDYEALVEHLVKTSPYDIAMYRAIGCQNFEEFRDTGDSQVAVLRHHGLVDGMNIYDLGCGSGRTAHALLRSDWKGAYTGADIIDRLVEYLKENCPGCEAIVNRELNIVAPDGSLDMIFHWSLFTHLFIEEAYLYFKDIHRALKPGGRLMFSFVELENESHVRVFRSRVELFANKQHFGQLDTFLHRDWIRKWAAEIGFAAPRFTDGADRTHHPPVWQSVAAMDKPA